MNDVLQDIEVIESALIAFSQGASDEKYAAFYSLEKYYIHMQLFHCATIHLRFRMKSPIIF